MTQTTRTTATSRLRLVTLLFATLFLAVAATSCTQRYLVCPDDASTGGYVPAMTPSQRPVVINLQETVIAAYPSNGMATAVGRAPWRPHYGAAAYMMVTGIGWAGVAIVNSGDDFVDPSATIAVSALALSGLFIYLARQNDGAEERNYGVLPETVGQCWRNQATQGQGAR